MRIFHAGGLFFCNPRLELHRRFFVEQRGMDGIDELIEAGPASEKTPPRGDRSPFARLLRPEARAKEGLKKDVRVDVTCSKSFPVFFWLAWLAWAWEVTGCKTVSKKSLVTVGMTGLAKSPGKIDLY